MGYLTEQVERIHQMVAALQPQVATDKHLIVEIEEACEITRKAKPTIYTLARKGLIPAYKRGKKLYFYEDELLQWIESAKAYSGSHLTRLGGRDSSRSDTQAQRRYLTSNRLGYEQTIDSREFYW